MGPLTDRLVGRDPATLFVMRGADATLVRRGRVVPGRVIAEGLASTAVDLLTRRSSSGLVGLEFLYLLAGDPGRPWGDVEGTWRTSGGALPLHGSGELLAGGPLLRLLARRVRSGA